jgi:hypothetical protein
MTNEDELNGILDEIIAESNKLNYKILATRMRTDREFTLDLLSFFSILCIKHPFIIVELNKQFLNH